MNPEYEALKIGALLHDIGKFIQRADTYPNKKTHGKFGIEFLENHRNNIPILENLGKDEIKIALDIVEKHHDNIKKGIISIVRLADWLSSGERRTMDKETDCYNRNSQYLMSIFESISLGNHKIKNYEDSQKYDLKPLNVSKTAIYLSPNRSYNELKEDFLNELGHVNNFERLCQLMQKYTWCIPSATYWKSGKEIKGYLPDVSLFDHSKTTCAIACSLYKNEKINEEDIENLLNTLNKEATKIKEIKDKYGGKPEKISKIGKLLKNGIKYSNKDLFSLIHGDISGVQDFIFNITSKGANKSLKGRSFYLDFLTELCAKYVIQELDLPITNILFYGGGHFYILSYNVDGKKVADFEEKINDILFEKFGADLYVAIGKVDLRPIDFLMDCMDEDIKIGIPYKWKESTEATSKKKMKKFSYKGMELFNPKGNGDESKRCPICKNEMKNPNELDNHIKICENCASFIEITNFLKKFEKEGTINYNSDNHSKIFKKTKFFNELPSLKEFYKLIKFENEGYNLPKDGELKIPYKIWSIAFPLDDKDIKDFSELGEDAKKRTGTNKIAILKMDVDNLGKIITKGLGNGATISRLSTLSSMLTLFFTGYIPYLIKSSDEYKNSIYLTYSGGDDTLIVGAWDKVWDLAKQIRDDFKKFVCENEDITLSAGVVLVSPKFEYRKGVYLAEEELENAKENKVKIDGGEKEKNSVSIFGHSLNWNKIEDEKKLEEEFVNAIDKLGKKRVVQLVQKTSINLRKALRKNTPETEIRINIPYLWRIKYYLYRNYSKKEEGLDNNVEFIDNYLNDIENKIRKCDVEKLEEINFNDIIIASRIAELKSRNEEGVNNELGK
jgi:CRISPR-associated protein Csm1